MNRILIIQTAFLGDVILATAVVNETKKLFPNARIDILVKKGNESLLENNPKLNTVLTLNKSKKKLQEIYRLTRKIKKTNYDLICNFHRFGSSGFITAFSGAKRKYGFNKNPFAKYFTKTFPHTIGDGPHEIERNLQFLKEFGGKRFAAPELFPSEKHFDKVAPLQKECDYYCIAPASVWHTKQVPEKKWVELIQQLNATVYLLGAKEDIVFCSSIINNIQKEKVINLAGQLSLLESAALIDGAKRTYVNDSAPLHICSAMNAPVTAFFCSTTPFFGFWPTSEDAQLLEVNDLPCKPCGIHGHKKCPEGHFNCSNIDLQTLKK